MTKYQDSELEVKLIPVKDLLLDLDNPRFFNLRELEGKNPSERDLETEIESDEKFPTLQKAIKHVGVKDPIWVKKLKNGRYLVIEGNLRTTCLRKLMRDGAKPPSGVRYDMVKAHVYPENTPESELLLQRVRLQAGKHPWDRFNQAATTYKLRYTHGQEEEDIATELQISIKEVQQRINDYKLFLDFSKRTKEKRPERFSMIAEAPKKVRDWMEESDANKNAYFKLISPQNGTTKLRSIHARGGLRDFALVIDHPKVLKDLVRDKDMTVEEAVEIVRESNILTELPSLKKMGTIATQLNGLNEEQIEKLGEDEKLVRNVKKLNRACEGILTKLGISK